jgi:hypothetical protein
MKSNKGQELKNYERVVLSFLCIAHLLIEIFTPMKFTIDISKGFLSYVLDKKLVWKITKDNDSKIMHARVIIIVHCTLRDWDLSTFEVSCWYLKGLLSYALDKNKVWNITNGNNSKIIKGRVIIPPNGIFPQ